MEKITLTIDGVKVEAQKGMTVLQAARNAGIYIPSLCAHKDLSPYGACRLCVVEIDGVRGTPTSCTTPASDGMVVRTNTEQLNVQRRRTLELLMSGHTSACFSCDSREDCEQVKPEPAKAGVSTRCGTCSNRPDCTMRSITSGITREMNLPHLYSLDKIERDDPFIDRDHNLCVLCGICFRTCEKVHNGKGAISIINRGKNAKIASAFDKDWNFEECTFCGACVDECPTGSLTDRFSKWYGKANKLIKTNCELCPEKCSLNLRVKNTRFIGTEKLSLNPEDAICAAGRFAMVQIASTAGRLAFPYVRNEEAEMIPSTFAEASAKFAEVVKAENENILVAMPETASNDAIANAKAIAKGGDFVLLKFDAIDLPEEIKNNINTGKYKIAFVGGNYVSAELASKIEHLAIFDFLKSDAQNNAEFVFAAALFGEDGEAIKKLPNQQSLQATLSEICALAELKPVSVDVAYAEYKSPKLAKANLPVAYMGHYIADLVEDMKAIGLPFTKNEEQSSAKGNFEVLENKLLAPNFHALKIKAPEMAKYAKAGQFAILMANEKSERSPFTICDWNADEGWVQFVLEEVGRSSSELGRLKAGEFLANASGPLGTPFDFEKFKAGDKVLLLGGCYGIAAIYPVARKLKEIGAFVSVAIEASTDNLLFFEDKLSSIADEFVVKTRDGSKGTKGGCSDVYASRGSEFDACVAIGCVFMMKQCSKYAESTNVSLCALNPIMVDGTGMCGACRVSVGSETKFACVDGPFFDLGKVDFVELSKRRTAYSLLEIDAIPRHLGSSCHK